MKRVKRMFSLLVVFCLLAGMTLAVDGTNPNADVFLKSSSSEIVPLASSSGGLQPIVTEYGKVSLSIDALGVYPGTTGTVQVNKPTDATVRKAFLASASTGYTGYHISNSDITINGNAVTMANELSNSIGSYNYWSDVTGIVKPIVDAAPAGLVDLTIVESSQTYNIDGTILIVVFDDPNQPYDNTVVLAYGAQNVAGDTFAIGLGEAINKSKPGFALDMSLGISYSYQNGGVQQYSRIDINSNRLTTSAGGEDDGLSTNGALITAGGIGDSNDNPAVPTATPTNPRSDDELYSLVSFVNNGDTSIDAYTLNPSNDDNVMFAGLFLGSTTAIVGEGILLSPVTAVNLIGEEHTVTATVQDVAGAPIPAAQVTFNITSGPNAGMTHTGFTDVNGQVSFSYVGNTVGTDKIVASFINNQQQVVSSNTATKEWQEPEIPEFTILGVLLASIVMLVIVVKRRK